MTVKGLRVSKKPLNIVFPKPINANNSHNNEHCYYVAASEGGKTSALKMMPRIKATDQVIFFDAYGDYVDGFKGKKVDVYKKIGDFYRAAVIARRSNAPFKIAFNPDVPNRDEFNNFCGVAWALGDGKHKKQLHVVIEEVAQFSNSGKAFSYFGNLMSVGRKFGFVISTLFQRGQEVPKTVLSNSAYKWIGVQESSNDSLYLATATGIPFKDIDSLVQLEYIYKKPGLRDNYVKGKLKFAKKK